MSISPLSGRVVARGPVYHNCSPGWRSEWYEGADGLPPGHYAHETGCRSGDVWECACGKVWVAYLARQGIDASWREVYPLRWRKERWRERRRRLRSAPTRKPSWLNP